MKQKYESKGFAIFFIGFMLYVIVFFTFPHTFIFWLPIRSPVQTNLILLKAVQSNLPLINKKNTFHKLVTGKWEH